MNTSHKSKQEVLDNLEEIRFILSTSVMDSAKEYEEAEQLLETVVRYVNNQKE